MDVINHPHPAGRCDNAAEYAVKLSFTGETPYDLVENLWCRPMPGKSFELCCIPFAAYNLALGDRITLEEVEDQTYAITEAVARSENATYRAWLTEKDWDYAALTHKLTSLGCLVETRPPKLLAINASRDQAGRLEQLLDTLTDEGYLTYERSFGPQFMDIKVHSSPVWKDRSNYIIQARVEYDGVREIREQLWARQIEGQAFQICCIPFFAFDLALSDLVEVENAGGEKGLIRRVIQKSDHDTLWIYFRDLRYGDTQRRIEQKIREMALFEWYEPRLLAVDVAPAQRHDVVSSLSPEIKASEVMVVSSRTQALITP
jgi:hypothetical protein